MSEQRQSSAPQQPPRRPRTVHKRHSVVLYIVILFLAACLLILICNSLSLLYVASCQNDIFVIVACRSGSTLYENQLCSFAKL